MARASLWQYARLAEQYPITDEEIDQEIDAGENGATGPAKEQAELNAARHLDTNVVVSAGLKLSSVPFSLWRIGCWRGGCSS